MEHWQVMFAMAIGGVTIGLPWALVDSIRVPVKKWAIAVVYALVGSACFSLVVAAGGECQFLETFLMLRNGCNNLPFANTRTVPVLNTLAFICILLSIIAALRAVISSVFSRKA